MNYRSVADSRLIAAQSEIAAKTRLALGLVKISLWAVEKFAHHCLRACCALVFDTVLAICRSVKTISETYTPDLVRNRMVLALASGTSTPTIGISTHSFIFMPAPG